MEIAKIKDVFSVRKLNQEYVNWLTDEFKENGYQSAYPVSVTKDGVMWDGGHRLAACKALQWSEIPSIVETPENLRRAAHERNRAASSVLPETFVDHAEEIWEMLATMKQEDVSNELGGKDKGWSVDKVKKYSKLQNIHNEAWKIVPTNFEIGTLYGNSVGTIKVPAGTFTENLLRDITNLLPDEQIELVNDLASGAINKGKFKTMAKAYSNRYKMAVKLRELLKGMDDDSLLSNALVEIDKGRYDSRPEDISVLAKQVLNDYQKKNAIRLINGDFYKEVESIQTGTIDLIITDPPYNISSDNCFPFKDRSEINKDFGEWDKIKPVEFKNLFSIWTKHFKRILSLDGSGYIFTSDIYLSYLIESLKEAGLDHRMTLTWHKINPGTSVKKRNFTSSTEYIVYFSQGKPVFNFTNENEMHNHIENSICQGNERKKDAKGNTLHPTQKPESIIKHLMDISSNRGQTIFDGFMGVGTVCSVAKQMGRQFIGIEKERIFYESI
ncbi:MAG: ParB N-terminal domain-containing protein [Desulfobacteraceae bacterium]|nr:ParB N-terminal domain-containing protein [Desulfobacteraceae bacterium]